MPSDHPKSVKRLAVVAPAEAKAKVGKAITYPKGSKCLGCSFLEIRDDEVSNLLNQFIHFKL
jgi:hypothetical protein